MLRELVSFQRCKIINPSECRLALMTNYEERQVRRILGKLREKGLISYAKYPRDFRGPNRPTNTYTLHFDKIQRLIDAGKVVVAKALGTYYDKRGVPKHDRKVPVKMSGLPSGQDVPQDVSLSIENLHLSNHGDVEAPYIECDMEEVSELSYEEMCEREKWSNEEKDTNITPYAQSTSDNPEQSEYDNNKEPITPSPHCAAPPSPLPAGRDSNRSVEQTEHPKLAPDVSTPPAVSIATPMRDGKPVSPISATFAQARLLALDHTDHFNPYVERNRKLVDYFRHEVHWHFDCLDFTPDKVLAAFKYFVDKYLANRTSKVDDPLGMFFQHKTKVVMEEMKRADPNAAA